jgi:hypothetical protein
MTAEDPLERRARGGTRIARDTVTGALAATTMKIVLVIDLRRVDPLTTILLLVAATTTRTAGTSHRLRTHTLMAGRMTGLPETILPAKAGTPGRAIPAIPMNEAHATRVWSPPIPVVLAVW